MGDSEHEILEKIGKITAKSSQTASKVKNNFAKMQKLNAESLKKLEEMFQDSEKELDKLERKISKSKGLANESKVRIRVEIKTTRTLVTEKYKELKSKVASIISNCTLLTRDERSTVKARANAIPSTIPNLLKHVMPIFTSRL